MAPGPNEVNVVDQPEQVSLDDGMSLGAVIYISVLFTILVMSFVLMCMKMSFLGQKTRSPQQRRMYVGTRSRPSLGSHEPTIYVSPSNLPPPPKYECMAPPSYEEVVGIHYPNYQVQQPIAQPIATALAQTQPTTTAQANDTRPNEVTRSTEESVVVTTVNERPTVTSNSS